MFSSIRTLVFSSILLLLGLLLVFSSIRTLERSSSAPRQAHWSAQCSMLLSSSTLAVSDSIGVAAWRLEAGYACLLAACLVARNQVNMGLFRSWAAYKEQRTCRNENRKIEASTVRCRINGRTALCRASGHTIWFRLLSFIKKFTSI